MQNQTIILQPTASELLKLITLSSSDKNTSVKLTVEITPIESEFMTTKEVARYIGSSKRTVDSLIQKNTIIGVKSASNKWKFKRNYIVELHKNNII